MNRNKALLIFFLPPIIAFSQKAEVNFSLVDSFATTVKYKRDLTVLTQELTSPYPEQLFKARAIFKWIAENIRYDYKYYNRYYYKSKEPKTYKCKDDKDCEAKRIVWEIRYIDRILRRKKAVCQGYSMLFKKMCDIAGLRSEMVPGYVRTEHYQVGTAGTLDHVWNTVWIDSTYYLLDATWAAGGCGKNDDGKLLRFTKNFNGYYWLTPAADFARNHFPQNNKWVLLPNYTKDSFAANPYYLSSEIRNIKLLTPSSGVIAAKKGDTIRFKIDYTGFFKELQINTNLFRNPDIWVWDEISKRKKVPGLDTLAIKKQKYINYKRDGSIYEFEYVVSDNSLYFMDILFDRQRMMRFKIVTNK
ncbi:MAG TPA: transglutaminase domain-containing protein [Chitinophagaceae bacterium]|nr:transglutaminase domain-containing protein [Chitinophagaceae bacterium]